VFLTGNLFGQSLVLSNVDELVTDAPSAQLMKAQATVTNTSSAAIDVLVRFEEVTAGPAGSGYYFCWTVCYDEGFVSDGFETPANHSMMIDAGASTDVFFADYVPNNTVGFAEHRFTFFDKNNPSDAATIDVRFDTESVGIEELEEGANGISESYPNPAKSVANINYSIAADSKDAQLVVYSMLGSKVREVTLTEERGTVKLDVSSLPSGMYFYSLVVEDKAISTKKMLVTK